MGLLDDILPDVAATVADVLGPVTVTVRRETSEGYDPTQGEGVSTTKDYTVPCFPPQRYAVTQINGTTVKSGDMQLMVPAQALTDLGVIPDPGTDALLFGGELFQMIAVDRVYSGTSVVLYTFQIRK